MTDEPELLQRVTNIGRRDQKGKLRYTFREDGEERNTVFWPKAKSSHFNGCVIGYIYEISGGIPPIWADCKVGELPLEERLALQTLDRAAYQKQQQKYVNSTPDLDDLIKQLREARFAVDSRNRTAFDAWLLGKLGILG